MIHRDIRHEDPYARIVVLEDAAVVGKEIFVDTWPKPSLKYATMMTPHVRNRTWRQNFRSHFWKLLHRPHARLQNGEVNNTAIQEFDSSLLVFDTWGTNSYYHLLIDTILPLWATKKYIEEANPGLNALELYRISGAGRDLANIQEIFSYFLGSGFKDHYTGKYQKIFYGYFSNHRIYPGPNRRNKFSQSIERCVKEFRKQFCIFSNTEKNKRILVPTRMDRKMDFVDFFTERNSHKFIFQKIDYSSLSVREQIETAGHFQIMFGDEGAAFANQIFSPKGALIAPVTKEANRLDFHKWPSFYCDHEFMSIDCSVKNWESLEDNLIKKFESKLT